MDQNTMNGPDAYLYSLLLDHINDGINAVDKTGRLIYVNAVSANYVGLSPASMFGKPVTDFYPDAALVEVIRTHTPVLNKPVVYPDGRKYLASAFPLFENGHFSGGYSVFKSIDDIEALNKKIHFLELLVQAPRPKVTCPLIGSDASLKEVLLKARKAVGAPGGPRHSIITGPSGTGKTALAAYIHDFACQIGILEKNAPFVEINCAQFINADMAAMEVFGSVKGAFTGSLEKRGLFEMADGGVLFLDEAHALGQHQTLLLKAIESGKVRRLGGTKDIPTQVILIAASTQNLQEVLLPELYQRLAQNEMAMPALDSRSFQEKAELMDSFVHAYVTSARERNQVNLQIVFDPIAAEHLLNRGYPRNIRQFRDAVNTAIDNASPLISDMHPYDSLTVTVFPKHLPPASDSPVPRRTPESSRPSDFPVERIRFLRDMAMGPRRISELLSREGYSIPYHRIAYYLKKAGL